MVIAPKYLFVLLSLLSIVSIVVAQDECPAEVDDAVFALNDVCTDVGRNQACYGNGEIVAIPVSNTVLDFTLPGDIASVDDIESLSLSPFEANIDEWGVAVLVLQADLPDTLPGQNVTMLLFGDVSLSNSEGAYYFTSGIGTPSCNQAPSGVLIQTPEGAGQVHLTMNGIDISLGSTAYLGTMEEDMLTFALLEGNSTLSIDGSEVELESEQFTTIELDEEGDATGDFAAPESIDELDLPQLPLIYLPEDIREDEGGDSGDTVSVPSEAITPLDGTWAYSFDSMNFEGNCPSFLNEDTIRQNMGEFGATEGITREITFEDDDISGLFIIDAFEETGLTYTLDNSEPNIFTVYFEIPEAGSVTYTWRILSETSVQGEIVQNLVIPDFADCTITSIINLEHQG